MMTQQYHIAFSVFFRHTFFSDGKLRCLAVFPTAETELLLRNMGAIGKPFQDGFHILYDAFAYGKERSRKEFLKEEAQLKFTVINKDSSFFNYTSDFNTDISRNYFFFENRTTGEKENLQTGSAVGKEDLRPVNTADPGLFVKPFGLISIRLHKDLAKEFVISFASAETYWCYILTTNYLQELNDPAIIRKETKEPFEGPINVQLTEKSTGMAFLSGATVQLAERAMNHTCQLVEHYNTSSGSYKVVLPALPGPDRRHISSVKTIDEYKDKAISYIFI